MKASSGLQRAALAATSVVVVGLAALNWHLAGSVIDHAPRPVPAVSGGASGASAMAQPGMKALDDAFTRRTVARDPVLLARPVFRADRRPFTAVPRPAPAPVEREALQLPQALRLLGLVGDPRRGRIALVATKREPKGRWLEAGGEVEGWRLAEIGAEHVLLVAGDQRHHVSLYPHR